MALHNEKTFEKPLKLIDTKLPFRLVYHFCNFVQYIVLYVFSKKTLESISETKGSYDQWSYVGPFKWILTFQAAFLVLAFIHDIFEWRDAQESLRAKKIAYWRDVIFQSMVVPYTLFVSSMFWSLYLYDRELVFPKVYDVILPWWFNHCVHTNITIIVLVETVLQARRHPVNFKLEIIINSVIAVAYAIVYYSIFFFANRWLYNIFGVLTWWQVVLYQLLIWASSYFFYFIQFPINRLFHGSEPETAEVTETAEVEQKTEEERKPGSDMAKNFEIASMQKEPDTPFSTNNWSLKYRSLREKFENSRL